MSLCFSEPFAFGQQRFYSETYSQTFFEKCNTTFVKQQLSSLFGFVVLLLGPRTNQPVLQNCHIMNLGVLYLIMRFSVPSFRAGAYLRENCLLSHNAAAK